ncbi:VOC family protein [Nocardioides bigeumensis]|uniref:VOC family protein n=1 Tax=Nocardioides bigeumensis TaxID=433657 RepID=A0ABP5JV07_9ACTN
MTTHSPVVHWEIGARNAPALGSFLREMFGWEVVPAGPEYWLVPDGHSGIGGGILQVADEVPSYLTFYVQVEDLEQAVEHAIELGGKEVIGPMTVPGVGRFAMFADPEGHVLGMLEPAPGEVA